MGNFKLAPKTMKVFYSKILSIQTYIFRNMEKTKFLYFVTVNKLKLTPIQSHKFHIYWGYFQFVFNRTQQRVSYLVC